MQKTTIEFASHSWSPIIMKCPRGCEKCWHIRMCKRQAKNPRISQEYRDIYAGKGLPMLDEKRLRQPLQHKSATTTVVQFMGDLFAPTVPDMWRRQVWSIMYQASQHTFIVLTKYARQMKDFMETLGVTLTSLPNVIGMVSVSTQKDADERIPWLLQTPLAIRGVNVEQMLGPVDLYAAVFEGPESPFNGGDGWPPYCNMRNVNGRYGRYDDGGINWVSAGCESSNGRVGRPAEPDWFRSLRDQCKASGTPYFLKQMAIDGKLVSMPMLDGKVWDEMPAKWRETALAGRKMKGDVGGVTEGRRLI